MAWESSGRGEPWQGKALAGKSSGRGEHWQARALAEALAEARENHKGWDRGQRQERTCVKSRWGQVQVGRGGFERRYGSGLPLFTTD